MARGTPGPLILHASAVAVDKAGLVITGAAGAGKSTLAMQMIALGARLVADDRVTAEHLAEGGLRIAAPAAIAGLIEARGLGLLTVPAAPAIARGVVDLDRVETSRLPEPHEAVIAGERLPCLWKVESPAFAAMLMLWLKGERAER